MARLGRLIVATALPLVVHNSSAYACSPASCEPGDTFPTSGSIPSNALAWFTMSSTVSAEAADAGSVEDGIKVFVMPSDAGQEVEFELTSDGTPSPDWPGGADEVWVPSTSIAAGTRLRVESSLNCGQSVESSEITVTEPAPLPTSLGTLAVATSVGPLLLWTNSGSCVDRVPAVYADVEVTLTPEAQPFADVLRYSLLVDGEHYRSTDYDEYDEELDSGGWPPRRPISGSEHGPGKDRVYATCVPHQGGELGVAATQHELQMVALLPDGTTITSDVVGVDLTCPSCEAEGGTDCNATDGGVATDEAVDASASSPTTDPSAATDAGPDTATDDTATPDTATSDTATPDTTTTDAPDGSQSDTSVPGNGSSATTAPTAATSTNAAPITTTATSTVHSSTLSTATPVAPNHAGSTRDVVMSRPLVVIPTTLQTPVSPRIRTPRQTNAT